MKDQALARNGPGQIKGGDEQIGRIRRRCRGGPLATQGRLGDHIAGSGQRRALG
jgi:hypothetical protein